MGPGAALAALACVAGVGRGLGGAPRAESLAWTALGLGVASWGAGAAATLALDTAVWDPVWGRLALRAAGWRPIGVAWVGAGVLHLARFLVDPPPLAGPVSRAAASVSFALALAASAALLVGLVDVEIAALGWVGRGVGTGVAWITLSMAMALGMIASISAAATLAWCWGRSGT